MNAHHAFVQEPWDHCHGFLALCFTVGICRHSGQIAIPVPILHYLHSLEVQFEVSIRHRSRRAVPC